MVSARRAARAGLNGPQSARDDVPAWVWGFSARDWVREHNGSLDGRFEAYGEWRRKRDAWLRERGKVVSGMAGLSFEEYRRIEREEPWRVLRRPAG